MKVAYDKYYQTENLFGEPYPELITFYANYPERGKLLDLGCGQGRDAIPLARLGYNVTGVDNSEVGIRELNKTARNEDLNLIGIVADIYEYDVSKFDFILLDNMFHFAKNDQKNETGFIRRIIKNSGPETIITFCIQNNGKKIRILNETIDSQGRVERINETDLMYEYRENQTGHSSKTAYKMIVIKK